MDPTTPGPQDRLLTQLAMIPTTQTPNDGADWFPPVDIAEDAEEYLFKTGINGLEATRQIKVRPQAPAVILVTADDTPGCRAAARAAGTDAFVDKQHLFAQLGRAIRKLFPAKRYAELKKECSERGGEISRDIGLQD